MSNKVYLLLAGVNGAGKSTLYNIAGSYGPIFPFCDSNMFQELPLVNSDNIVRELGDWRDATTQFAAGKIAAKKIRDFLEGGVSFTQETTLSGRSILRNIDTAKANGYKVGILYVGLESADIAKERVGIRVSRGGHGIPDELVERRYGNSFENLNKIMRKCDGVLLYDNSSDKGFRQVAEFDGQHLKMIGDYVQLPDWIKSRIEMPVVKTCEKTVENIKKDVWDLDIDF